MAKMVTRSTTSRVTRPTTSAVTGNGVSGGSANTINWYVDSENGSDSNNGTAIDSAFQTLAKLATVIQAGDSVGFVRGSYWEEDLNLATTHDLTFQAVGTGNLPILDGSYVYSGSWEDSTDRADANTDVYSIEIQQTLSEGYLSVWEDGARLQWVTSLANCQSTPGSFFIPDDGTGSGKTSAGTHTIYMHPLGSTNAKSDGKERRITDPTREGQMHLGNNCTVTGLETRRNAHANGSFQAGFNGLAIGCYFHDGVKHESLMASGEYRFCVGEHLTDDVRENNIIMEFYVSNGAGYSCKYDRCIVIGPGANAAQTVAGFDGHNEVDSATFYDTIDVVDCAAFGVTAGAIGGSTQVSASITRCYMENCRKGSTVEAVGAKVQIVDCWWVNNVTATTGDFRAFVAGPGRIEGLRMFNDNGNVFTVFESDFEIHESVIVYNSMTKSGNAVFRRPPNSSVIVMKKTVISHPATAQILSPLDYEAATGITRDMENNVYYTNSGSSLRFRVLGVNYTNPTAYLAAHPETGTQVINPLLADAANGDFTVGNAGVINGAGLVRHDIDYIDSIPADIRAWIDAQLAA